MALMMLSMFFFYYHFVQVLLSAGFVTEITFMLCSVAVRKFTVRKFLLPDITGLFYIYSLEFVSSSVVVACSTDDESAGETSFHQWGLLLFLLSPWILQANCCF